MLAMELPTGSPIVYPAGPSSQSVSPSAASAGNRSSRVVELTMTKFTKARCGVTLAGSKHSVSVASISPGSVAEDAGFKVVAALAAGIVSAVHPLPTLLQAAMSKAEELAQLGKNRWLM